MQTNHQIKVIYRHIVRYACGCTTTLVEAERTSPAALPICTSHDCIAISEETTTEYRQTADPQSVPQR